MRTLSCPRPGRLFRMVLLLIGFASTHVAYASPSSPTSAPTASPQQNEGVSISAAGHISLLATAFPPPLAASFDTSIVFDRYGFVIAAPQLFDQPTRRVAFNFDAAVPAGTALRIDLRASVDGQRWSDWDIDVANGTVVTLPLRASVVQYRATLFGSLIDSPLLRQVTIAPLPSPPEYQTFAQPVAPTYKVRATRMGMVGGRTANGHRITKRDHFVSLPSWRSLSSKGGHEYQVRISYKDRSTVVPVWDVGPWNTRDDYWNAERERYKDLEQGWPEDHAAYYQHYNNRRAEKGYVRFPTAVDVADGVWWDDLGIKGDQADVHVTFLWMGSDPEAAP